MIYFHYSLFIWLSVHVCTPAKAAAAQMNDSSTTRRVYYSYTVKSAAAMPTNLSTDESFTVLPCLLFVWFASTFDFTKKKRNMLLGLWKSNILPNF